MRLANKVGNVDSVGHPYRGDADDEPDGLGVYGFNGVQGVHLTDRARMLVTLHQPPLTVADGLWR